MIMKKPESVDEAKEWLKELADYLGKVPYASSRLLFASSSIREYLSGENNSLDDAFGLDGRKKKRISKNRGLALQAFEMRRNGMTWEGICDELNFYDSRELRRIVKKNMSEINDLLSDEIMKEFIEEERDK